MVENPNTVYYYEEFLYDPKTKNLKDHRFCLGREDDLKWIEQDINRSYDLITAFSNFPIEESIRVKSFEDLEKELQRIKEKREEEFTQQTLNFLRGPTKNLPAITLKAYPTLGIYGYLKDTYIGDKLAIANAIAFIVHKKHLDEGLKYIAKKRISKRQEADVGIRNQLYRLNEMELVDLERETTLEEMVFSLHDFDFQEMNHAFHKLISERLYSRIEPRRNRILTYARDVLELCSNLDFSDFKIPINDLNEYDLRVWGIYDQFVDKLYEKQMILKANSKR